VTDRGPSRTSADNPVPSKVLDPEQQLLIDAELKQLLSRSTPPCIRENLREDAIYVGRRCLEVSILAAVSAAEDNPPRADWEWRWERKRDKAKEAAGALGAMLQAHSPALEEVDLVRSLVNTRIGGLSAGVRSRMKLQAQEDLGTLQRAQALAEQVAADAERRRREFLAGRKNPGRPDQREFVRILAEGWIFLVGRRPGASPDESKNPFLRFASAAWSDWKEDAEAPVFVGALRHFLSELNDQHLTTLVKDGPSWLGVTKPYLNFQ
jgi:hypothetical protein